MQMRFKYKEITDIILKSFYEVYNELGDGFLESVYENVLYIVLTGHRLCVERQKDISVFFRGKVIGDFKADLIVNEKVIVELKAVRTLAPAHEAQLINFTTIHFLNLDNLLISKQIKSIDKSNYKYYYKLPIN